MKRCMEHLPALRVHPSEASYLTGLIALILVLGAGCRSTPPTASQILEERADARLELERALESEAAVLEPGSLRVRLAFHAGADLDLFVTDPLEETVYFANSPSASGGRLEQDVQCDDPAPRIETIAFAEPESGRYRIGVDFPARCNGSDDPVLFVVSVEHGAHRAQKAGVIGTREFLAIVHEVVLP